MRHHQKGYQWIQDSNQLAQSWLCKSKNIIMLAYNNYLLLWIHLEMELGDITFLQYTV